MEENSLQKDVYFFQAKLTKLNYVNVDTNIP